MVKHNLLCVLTSALVIAPNIGYTTPTGGQIIAGQATISNPSVNLTLITQSTAKAILQFDSFNINQQQTVQFVQPSSSSVALNRVASANPTTILGNLTANGQVFIVNPRGVIFGQSARVDVGGLVATTLDITNNDFLAGNLHFSRVAGSPSADVINNGEITADNGYVILAGDYTENTGANLGTVALASGHALTLDLQGDGMISFAIDQTAVNALRGVNNQGTILADGGAVFLTASVANDLVATAVRNDGLIQARSIVERAGEIFLSGFSGDTLNSGTLDVRGSNAVDGGLIAVTGERVALFANAKLDASGKNGGTIRVGGDFQGQGDTLTAQNTVVTANVTLNAQALVEGDGGRVIVWADNSTRFSGAINVQGGAVAGDGGFVEVSGRQFLQFDGAVALSAAHGQSGTLLLDPFNIFITDAAAGGVSDAEVLDETVLFADGGANSFFISQTTLEGLTGNVILQAENDIQIQNLVDNNLNFSNLTAGESVVFQAGNDILFLDPTDTITTQGAAIHLEANSVHSAAAGLNNGAVILGGLNANGGAITVLGDTITLLGAAISGGQIDIGQGLTAGDNGLGNNAVVSTASAIAFNAATTFASTGSTRFTAQDIAINNAFQADGFDITFTGDVLGNFAFPTGTVNLVAANDIRFVGDLRFENTAINATANGDIMIQGDVLFNQADQVRFSFTGNFATDDDVVLFDFSTGGVGEVTIQTFGSTGGVNAQGVNIVGGGFDPIVALFDGIGDFIVLNDDGALGLDSTIIIELGAGDFTVALTQFNNFFSGVNLNEGFPGSVSTSIADGFVSPFFAFDITGANVVNANIAAGGAIDKAIVSNFTAGQDFIQTGNLDLADLFPGSSLNITTGRDTTINGDLIATASDFAVNGVGRDLTITGTTQITATVDGTVGDQVTFSAVRDINLGAVAIIGNPTLPSAVNFNAGENVQVNSLAASLAGFDANISANGNALLGNIAALTVNVSTGGDVTLQNAINASDGTIAATGNVSVNADIINNVNNIAIVAQGDVKQTQGVILAENGGVNISATNIALTNIEARANSLVNNLAINIDGQNSIMLGDVTANAVPGLNVSIRQGDTTVVNGDILASGDLDLLANNGIAVLGTSQISAENLRINADANNDGIGNLSAQPDVRFIGTNVTIDAVIAEFDRAQIQSVNPPIINAQFIVDASNPIVVDVISGAVQQAGMISTATQRESPERDSAQTSESTTEDEEASESLKSQPLVQIAEGGNACQP